VQHELTVAPVKKGRRRHMREADSNIDTPWGRAIEAHSVMSGVLLVLAERGSGLMVTKGTAAQRLSLLAQAQGLRCGDWLGYDTRSAWAVALWEMPDALRAYLALVRRTHKRVKLDPGFVADPVRFMTLVLNACHPDYLRAVAPASLLPPDQVCAVDNAGAPKSGTVVVYMAGGATHEVSAVSWAIAFQTKGKRQQDIYLADLEVLSDQPAA
jgi:hypothetical protein